MAKWWENTNEEKYENKQSNSSGIQNCDIKENVCTIAHLILEIPRQEIEINQLKSVIWL